jgi:hypothetical protein
MSPEMGELSMDQVNLQGPPPPPAPPAPPLTTEEAKPTSLLDAIKGGKKLKPTITKERKTAYEVGRTEEEINNANIASSSNVKIEDTVKKPQTLTEALSAKFDSIKKAVQGVDDDDENP